MLWDLPNAVDDRTHGFNTFPTTIPNAGACTIVDFAGQPEFWTPNALFMDTVSGVFVLLCKLTDPFEDQFEQLRYWVRSIPWVTVATGKQTACGDSGVGGDSPRDRD